MRMFLQKVFHFIVYHGQGHFLIPIILGSIVPPVGQNLSAKLGSDRTARLQSFLLFRFLHLLFLYIEFYLQKL